MLIYLIDAFNVIHQIGSMHESASPHSDFISYIRAHRLTGSRMNRVVIVFDGYGNASSFAEKEYEIHFSNARMADDLIKEFIAGARHKGMHVVVSDDHEVRDFARSEGARVQGVDDFIRPRHSRNIGSSGENPEDESEKRIDEESVSELNKELEKRWGGK